MVDSMVDEALDNYVKATGRDGTQKCEELVNMRPGELRRSLEHWHARAKEVQRLQGKKEHAWNLYSRVPNFRFRNKRTSRVTSNTGQSTMARLMRGSCKNG